MSKVSISLGLAPHVDVVERALEAERLGYDRVWMYDSPALYGDIWVALARVAGATARIGLGTAVAVPSLRHPMVTASAIASVEELAPGRLVVAFGTGFTSRMTMGQKPMKWADLEIYTRQVRALLDGDVVEVEGKAAQMLHPDGWASKRPIGVPLWVAPSGPKGFGVADSLGVDGVVLAFVPPEPVPAGRATAVIVNGTVLRPGEDHTTPRVIDAAGPWFAASFHAAWEFAPDFLDQMPGGTTWRDAMVASRPENERHLAVHEGHVVTLSDRDRAAIAETGDAILSTGWTGDEKSIAARVEQAASIGITEIIYTAAGPDPIGEMTAFMAAASL